MPEDESSNALEMHSVRVTDISEDDTFMNRSELENIGDLAESIARDGQQVPVILRGKGPPYQVVSGFRRIQAIKSLSKGSKAARVKAIIHKTLPNTRAYRISLLENLQRESLSGYEQVLAAVKMREASLSVKEIADAFGLGPRAIQRYLRLNDCSKEVREALHAGSINTSAAYEVHVNGVPLSAVLGKGLSVRQIQALARGKKDPRKKEKYVHFRRFASGNFNLALKYKHELTDVDEAIACLQEALQILNEAREGDP